NERGCSEVHRTYDENGFIKSESYFDENGKQVELEDGFATIECINDSTGNIIYQRFYDLNGHLKKETDSDFYLAIK
ncbi:MAG: hypothetical protein IKF80_07860, partial [Erysipelotrichaceae bacterium]|nr:hypothetical protein [Erysipelotrichaceae bacterium]